MNNQLTIHDVMKLPIGTKVYRVSGGEITQLNTLCKHPRYDIFYFVLNSDVTDTASTSIRKDNHEYFTDYDSAKECMWKQLQEKMKSINEIYFDNKKSISYE